jgi:uncharacterized protein YlxW (UPF0749 family)
MTRDFTYLNQLNTADLMSRAFRDNWTGPEAHMIRALAERLEQYEDAYNMLDRLQADLDDAERRANSWREEAQAVQRQLDQVRG